MPEDMQAKVRRIVEMIETHGLARMREPDVRHLEGKLWEMRMTGRDGIARSIYVTAIGRRIIVLRTFVKNTQKAPRREIDLTLDRAKDVK